MPLIDDIIFDFRKGMVEELNRKAEKLGLDLGRYTLKGSEQGARQVEDRFNSLFKKVAGFLGAAFAIHKIRGFVKDALSEANEFERGWNRVKIAVEASGGSFDKVRPRLQAVAEELHKTTRFTDDEVIGSFERLVQMTGGVESAFAAIPTVATLAAGAQLTFADASEMLSRGLEGNTREFRRLNIRVKEGDDLFAAVQKRFGDAARNEMTASERGANALAKAWDDLKEAIGLGILAGSRASGVNQTLTRSVQELTRWVDEHRDLIARAAEAVLGLAAAVGTRLVQAIGNAANAWKATFFPPLVEVAGALADLNEWATKVRENLRNIDKALGWDVSGQNATIDAMKRQTASLRAWADARKTAADASVEALRKEAGDPASLSHGAADRAIGRLLGAHPRAPGAGPPGAGTVKETDEQRIAREKEILRLQTEEGKKQLEIAQDAREAFLAVQDQLADLTVSAVDNLQNLIDRAKIEMLSAPPELQAQWGEALQKMETDLQTTRLLEPLLSDIDALQPGLAKAQEYLSKGIVGPAKEVSAEFAQIRAELQAQLDLLDKQDPNYQKIKTTIQQIDTIQENLSKGIADGLNYGRNETAKWYDDLQQTLAIVQEIADQWLKVGEALGIVDDSAKQVIQSIQQIAQGVGELAGGIATGDPMAILKGGVDVIVGGIGLFPKDKDPGRLAANVELYKKALEGDLESLRELDRLSRAWATDKAKADAKAKYDAAKRFLEQQKAEDEAQKQRDQAEKDYKDEMERRRKAQEDAIKRTIESYKAREALDEQMEENARNADRHELAALERLRRSREIQENAVIRAVERQVGKAQEGGDFGEELDAMRKIEAIRQQQALERRNTIRAQLQQEQDTLNRLAQERLGLHTTEGFQAIENDIRQTRERMLDLQDDLADAQLDSNQIEVDALQDEIDAWEAFQERQQQAREDAQRERLDQMRKAEEAIVKHEEESVFAAELADLVKQSKRFGGTVQQAMEAAVHHYQEVLSSAVDYELGDDSPLFQYRLRQAQEQIEKARDALDEATTGGLGENLTPGFSVQRTVTESSAGAIIAYTSVLPGMARDIAAIRAVAERWRGVGISGAGGTGGSTRTLYQSMTMSEGNTGIAA